MRGWGTVSIFTFLSRISGYFRDVVIAYFFGAAVQTDAFYVAFRIPNLLRRLFAEGSLTVSFIPVFTEYNETSGKDEAIKALNAIFTVLFLILILVVVLGIVFAPYVVKAFAYGFSSDAFSLSVLLNRIMFSYILFISLTALSMGVLNSLRHFFAPAFSPILLNLSVIACAFLFHRHFDIPTVSLAVGVLFGGILQLLINLYFVRSKDFMFRFTSSVNHPAVRKVALLMMPQLFGIAVYNLNIIVNTQYASFMSEGTISYLYFAERLIEFPLGIIAVSIATVMLPALSSDAAMRDFEGFVKKYSDTLRLMFFVLVPAMVGLAVLGKPVCNLLYQHGEFDHGAVIETYSAVLGYSFGLFAVGGIRVTVPAFYALKDTKTPVIAAFIAFILNAVLGYLLGFTLDLDHFGLALASSVSSIINFMLLLIIIESRFGSFSKEEIIPYFFKILMLSVIMGAVVYILAGFNSWQSSSLTAGKILYFAVIIMSGVAIYFALARLFKIRELDFLVNVFARKVK